MHRSIRNPRRHDGLRLRRANLGKALYMVAGRDFPNEPRPGAHVGAMPDPVFTHTQHARAQIALRALDPAWIKRTILAPDASETDPGQPDRTRAFRAVPEREGRMLRVVFVVRSPSTFHIIIAFLDRGRRPGADEVPI